MGNNNGGLSEDQDNYGMGVTMSDVLKAIDDFVNGRTEDDEYGEEDGWGYELVGRLSETRREWAADYKSSKEVPNEPAIVPGYGRLVYVEGYEGGEGGGEDAYQVVKLVADDGSERYFRKEGYYASHYGCDWDGDLYEVVPYEKVVTFYDRRV